MEPFEQVFTASRKRHLPKLPEIDGYFVNVARVPHPSSSFSGFYIWKTWYSVSFRKMLEVHYGDGLVLELMTEEYHLIARRERKHTWQGSRIVIPFPER